MDLVYSPQQGAIYLCGGKFLPEVLDPAHQRERCLSFEGLGADYPVDLVLLQKSEAVPFSMMCFLHFRHLGK